LHLGQAEGEIGHGGQIDAIPSNVLVPTKGPVNAKALAIKDAFQPVSFTDVSKGTISDLAPFSVAAQGHLGQIVLVQKLAGASLHAQIPQPMPADHRSQPWIVFGTRQDGFGFVTDGKDGSGLAIGQGIQGFGNPVFQCIVFKIVFDGVGIDGILGEQTTTGSGRHGEMCIVFSVDIALKNKNKE